MNVLKEYYKDRKGKLQALSILIWLVLALIFLYLNELISEHLDIWANNEIRIVTMENLFFFKLILDLLFDFIAPTAIVLLIYNLALKYIDEKGWKKKYPECDISGKWKDITYYTRYLDEKGLSKISTEDNESSPVIIEQTCNKIKIKDSIGDGFKWYSLLCDWNGSNLDILYAVEYYSPLQQKGYPEKRYGYECMSIDTKDQQAKSRPNKMVGKFWHCCSSDGKPVYMGEVTYERDI